MWQEFLKCVSDQGSYGMNVCQNEREDYLECLHHTKLVSDSVGSCYTYLCIRIYILISPCAANENGRH